MSRQTKQFYEFDRFRIDLTERALRREGEFAPLHDQHQTSLILLANSLVGHI